MMARQQTQGQKQMKFKIGRNESEIFELAKVDAERKERRREQNRRAAQRCRTKKRMSQFTVVKKFEKVMEDNHCLKKQLDTLRRQRDDLKKHIAQYCCSGCVAKVPDISRLDIERGPAFNKDLATVSAREFTSVNEFKKDNSITFSERSTFLRCRFSSCDKNPTRVKQSSTPTPVNICQPTAVFSDSNHHGHMWQYVYHDSVFQKEHESSECMFTPSFPKTSILPHSREQRHDHLPHYRHQHQYSLDHSLHIEDCQTSFNQYSIPTTSNRLVPITNSIKTSCTQSVKYQDLCRLLQSNSSSYQIAASNSNQNASDHLPNMRLSNILECERSPSRSRISTPETSMSNFDNVAPGSVSAEPSFLGNKIVNVQQNIPTGAVPDIEDEDAFSMTSLNGNHIHDVNNNTCITRDSHANPFISDGMSQYDRVPIREAGAPGTVTERSESGLSMDNGLGIGDVHTLMMAISNDQLLFSSANRESGPSLDIIRDYRTYVPED